MKYILVDSANIFFKSKYIASKRDTDEERVGMALHLVINGVQSIVKKYGAGEPLHVVFCLEGKSWRKAVYPKYKANRAVKNASLTEEEIELDKKFFETYNEFTEYLSTKTNVSVIRNANSEADDIIARFIHLHPNDTHYIVSSDSDFAQLISPNVSQYNSLSGELITINGYYDAYGNPVKDKKTGEHKLLNDPQYILFEKTMRGDTSDNVFSAYPGVRSKSTKNKTGLIEAFNDRNKQGFCWNNMMLQRWVDHEGVEHLVRDDYERNRMLIDLSMQPQEIKDSVDQTILETVNKNIASHVGIHFLKFCNKHQLLKILDYAESYVGWLNQSYDGVLKETENV